MRESLIEDRNAYVPTSYVYACVFWQSVSLVAYVCVCVRVCPSIYFTRSALHADTECISQRLQRENAMLRRSQLELSQPASPKAHSPRSVDEERDVQNEVFDRMYLNTLT